MSRNVRILASVVVLLVFAAASFYGGTVYGKSQARATGAGSGFRQGFPGGGTPDPNRAGVFQNGAGRGGMLVGEIVETGDASLIIKDNNGKQTTVKVTDTTLIQKQASVKVTDLQPGETVLVSGSTGSDGSVSARSVQVAPPGRFAGGPPPNAQPAQNAASGN